MKRWLLVCALIAASAAPAWAQDRPGRGMQRGGPRFDREAMSDRLVRQLAEELQLTDEQRPQFDEIVAAFRDRRASEGDGGDPRALFEEMRAAREAGDDARVAELRDELRSRGDRMRNSMDQLMADLEPILTEDQVATLGDFRENAGRRMWENARRERGAAMIGELREQLQLRPDQESQFDQLAAELREKAEARGPGRDGGRELGRELRAAEAEGDEARAAEIRAELDEMRAAQRANRPIDEFFAGLEPLLDEEQLATLHEARARFEPQGPGGPGGPGGPDGFGGPGGPGGPGALGGPEGVDRPGGPDSRPGREADRANDPRSLLRAVRRLELTAEQKDQVAEIEKDYREQSRETDRRDREAQQVIGKQVRSDLEAILTAEQKAEFEKILERTARPLGERLRDRPGRDGEDRPRRERAPRSEPKDGDAETPVEKP